MTDHELNKLLAEVAGVSLYKINHGDPWLVAEDAVDPITNDWTLGLVSGKPWTPLTDHNQMALVKAALKEQGYDYGSDYFHKYQDFHGYIYKEQGDTFDPPILFIRGHGTDELRAFAMAVAQMRNA